MGNTEVFTIDCKHCDRKNLFEQPYPYHAGFTDQGFLYDDAGTLTLVWSMLDPVLNELFPDDPLWTLNLLHRRGFEKLLVPAPSGGRWRFRNPARCTHCGKPISDPMLRSVHYLLYPGSILTDRDGEFNLRKYLDIPA